MENWKTTSTGITMIVGGIVNLIFAIKANDTTAGVINTSLTSILGGVGLMFAKDFNVTSQK